MDTIQRVWRTMNNFYRPLKYHMQSIMEFLQSLVGNSGHVSCHFSHWFIGILAYKQWHMCCWNFWRKVSRFGQGLIKIKQGGAIELLCNWKVYSQEGHKDLQGNSGITWDFLARMISLVFHFIALSSWHFGIYTDCSFNLLVVLSSKLRYILTGFFFTGGQLHFCFFFLTNYIKFFSGLLWCVSLVLR